MGFGLLGMRILIYSPFGVRLHMINVLRFMTIMGAGLPIVLVDIKPLPFVNPLFGIFTTS